MPTTLGVNATGSTAQQSVITAIVQDAAGNLVGGREVRFLLMDTTGGTIFPAAAVTDDFGRASTVYTAGAVPSAQDGVTIQATVTGTAVVQQVKLTVARQALFVILGTGNLLQALSSTQYAKPYSALVTDANGNPVANATIELSVLPTRYQKGVYELIFDDTNCMGWAKGPSTITCPNEDLNLNGALDRDEDRNGNCVLDPGEDLNQDNVLGRGEDFNGNCVLDPGNVATTVPGTVVTDASGFAFFNVVYAKEFTWVEVALEARTTVAGSASSSQVVFFLSGLLSDFSDCNVPPPGVVSPYGMAATCDNPN
jgi:adhesin/invasin